MEIAIIKTGGKQYKVREGDTIKVEKLIDKGKIEFKDLLNGKKVTVEVVGEGRFPKVTIVKFKAKKRYHKTQGHRQQFSEIKILNIA